MLTSIAVALIGAVSAQVGYTLGSWRLNRAYDSGFRAGYQHGYEDTVEQINDAQARAAYLTTLRRRQMES